MKFFVQNLDFSIEFVAHRQYSRRNRSGQNMYGRHRLVRLLEWLDWAMIAIRRWLDHILHEYLPIRNGPSNNGCSSRRANRTWNRTRERRRAKWTENISTLRWEKYNMNQMAQLETARWPNENWSKRHEMRSALRTMIFVLSVDMDVSYNWSPSQ